MPKAISASEFPKHFWSRVNVGPVVGCWEWTGAKKENGYGTLKWKQQMLYAHRVAFSLLHGEILPGYCVCHKCDNPACCNPYHLFQGTHADNIHDAMTKGRHVAPPRVIPPKTKLNPTWVRAIRKQVTEIGNLEEVARINNLGASTIRRVARRESWGWVK